LVTGCREARPATTKAVVAETDLMTKARDAMGRRDYSSAATFLRDVVVHHPADLEAHYRLGVSASHLDQPDEAIREFEWVVAHGEATGPEVHIAREWLASRMTAPVQASTAPSASRQEPPPRPEMSSLVGRVVGAEGAKSRLQLFLKGAPGTPIQHEYHALRTDEQGNFRFTNVVPGDYMLTNAIAGPPTWRLRVSLTKGERFVLDLSPANQATVRDDFPELRP
jgi:hypothetical protein